MRYLYFARSRLGASAAGILLLWICLVLNAPALANDLRLGLVVSDTVSDDGRSLTLRWETTPGGLVGWLADYPGVTNPELVVERQIQDAVEFERALAALVSQRYVPAWPVSAPRGLGGLWWEINTGAGCVVRVARYVLFVQAPDLGLLADVVESLP